MVERRVTVENSLGIHARPATKILQAAAQFRSDIVLEVDGASADAKSIMSVIALAVPHNATVVIRARGEDEAAAAEALVRLFGSKFEEE
jgi:phosphocarrier protein HPr